LAVSYILLRVFVQASSFSTNLVCKSKNFVCQSTFTSYSDATRLLLQRRHKKAVDATLPRGEEAEKKHIIINHHLVESWVENSKLTLV